MSETPKAMKQNTFYKRKRNSNLPPNNDWKQCGIIIMIQPLQNIASLIIITQPITIFTGNIKKLTKVVTRSEKNVEAAKNHKKRYFETKNRKICPSWSEKS